MSRSVQLISVIAFLKTGLYMLKQINGVIKSEMELEDIINRLEKLQTKDIEARQGTNEYERF